MNKEEGERQHSQCDEIYEGGHALAAVSCVGWARLCCFMDCSDDEDEQNISSGMDAYCLVVEPGQWTAYGGVVECELSDDRLSLRLTERAAEELGTPTEVSFGLALDSTKLEVLRRGLRRVLTSGRANAVPHRLVV